MVTLELLIFWLICDGNNFNQAAAPEEKKVEAPKAAAPVKKAAPAKKAPAPPLKQRVNNTWKIENF